MLIPRKYQSIAVAAILLIFYLTILFLQRHSVV